MTSVGIWTEVFGVPVCNCFQAKNLDDQLCYEVDLNRFSNKDNTKEELKTGFTFLMDYNEDRQFTFDQTVEKMHDDSISKRIVNSEVKSNAILYLNTIGNWMKFD